MLIVLLRLECIRSIGRPVRHAVFSQTAAWHSTDLDARALSIVLVGRPPVVIYTLLTQTA
jgi:hypothetical protein